MASSIPPKRFSRDTKHWPQWETNIQEGREKNWGWRDEGEGRDVFIFWYFFYCYHRNQSWKTKSSSFVSFSPLSFRSPIPHPSFLLSPPTSPLLCFLFLFFIIIDVLRNKDGMQTTLSNRKAVTHTLRRMQGIPFIFICYILYFLLIFNFQFYLFS